LHKGTRNVGSGNTPWRKNDVRAHDGAALIEYKRTDKQSITIKLTDIEDLRRNALLEGREALFGIEIGGRDYLVVEAADYERQVQELQELQELRRLPTDHPIPRSIAGVTSLGVGQVPHPQGRPVLPGHGTAEQEGATGGPRPVHRPRRPRSVPDPGSLS